MSKTLDLKQLQTFQAVVRLGSFACLGLRTDLTDARRPLSERVETVLHDAAARSTRGRIHRA
jgi:hypothetical protein